MAGVQLLAPGPDVAFGAALGTQLGPAAKARDALHGLRDPTLAARARKASSAAAADSVYGLLSM